MWCTNYHCVVWEREPLKTKLVVFPPKAIFPKVLGSKTSKMCRTETQNLFCLLNQSQGKMIILSNLNNINIPRRECTDSQQKVTAANVGWEVESTCQHGSITVWPIMTSVYFLHGQQGRDWFSLHMRHVSCGTQCLEVRQSTRTHAAEWRDNENRKS